ncbi:unnamed protein product [Rotaria socialis]|uniref:Uncharacterized protein n=1 Tax=Rotaria socialis TaxID=392032 RepID=A0A820UX44_9BILA|nr:unnamed protein product [Rotaria socialis]CAF3468454.1 unnamed protein product [Rotaria socialis]CAF4491824.1 unnamed protein product [Rotaria socialis]CAF4492264.1 unnamed protein product [Rotaria socialis]
MHSFNIYFNFIFVILLLHFDSLHGMNINNTTSQIEQTTKINQFKNTLVKERKRRDFVNFFSDIHRPNIEARDSGTLIIGNSDIYSSIPQATWLKLARNQTNRLVEGATDLVLTPVNWLAHITNYWPFYIISAIIILSLITYLYCTFQARLGHLMVNKQFDPTLLTRFLQSHQPAQKASSI